MCAKEISLLMNMIPQEEKNAEQKKVKGGPFEGMTPFGEGVGEGVDRGRGESEWVVLADKPRYDILFEKLNPVNGTITGAAAKSEMVKSKLPNSTLGRIWKMCDIDKDGCFDADEFALAMHLINIKLDDNELPATLPEHLYPPSKREYMVPVEQTHGESESFGSVESLDAQNTLD